MNHALADLSIKKYGGAGSVRNDFLIDFIKQHTKPFQKTNVKNFLNNYKEWAFLNHNVKGINRFSYLTYSNGTTESFDKFYQKYTTKRLRLWQGEYFYHQIQARELFKNRFEWIEDSPISFNDVVVVSLPFSDTGEIPYNFDEIMWQCEKLKVPVLIDMAYINLTKNFQVNLNYSCIETVTSSLSKTFPVESFRIGIRMNQYYTDDTLDAYVHQPNPYVNHNSIYLAKNLIDSFSNNYMFDLYRKKQLEFCSALDLFPSSCFIFGIDYNQKFQEYNRGGDSNRLSFHRHFINENF